MDKMWILVWLVIITVTGVSSSTYQLVGPRNYVAFTEDIAISFRLPQGESLPRGQVQLLSLPSLAVMMSTGLPPGFREGELTIMCGVVDFAGDFIFRLLDKPGGSVLAESPVMHVTWPNFSLRIPDTHTALVNDVVLEFAVSEAKCKSTHAGRKFWFDVVYFGQNESDSWSLDSTLTQIVQRHEIDEFIEMHNVPMTFSCHIFDQAGIYRVNFRTNLEQEPIAQSNVMTSRWSTSYDLVTLSESVFPCDNSIVVQYSQPECSGNNDRIRLYRQERLVEGSAASPKNLNYVGEQRASNKQNGVAFDCFLFDESVVGYCFFYTSTSDSGAIHNQKTLCIPTSDLQASVVHGGWGPWLEWSECQPITGSCGLGRQSHSRTCDSPPPSPGGEFCSGDTVEWLECYAPCKGDPISTTSSTKVTPIPWPVKPECRCGCAMSDMQGRIMSTDCLGSNIWTIHVDEAYVIRLTFSMFNIDPGDRTTWIKVRDGDSQMSDLLVYNNGGTLPPNVTSTQNILMIEYMAPYESSGYQSMGEGFMAMYTTLKNNNSGILSADGAVYQQSVWASIVTIVGISLCVIIILATIAFVCHHRYENKKKRQKKQAAGESLLINGELPNSPSHSGNSVEGSKNQSYGSPAQSPMKNSSSGTPLRSPVKPALSPTKRDYVIATGPHEVEIGMDKQKGQLSRRSSHSSVTVAQPVQSPYTANANQADYKHDPHLFNVSPMPSSESPRRHRKHKHRHRSQSPPSASGGRRKSPSSPTKRVGSPHGSISPSREDPRNHSFKTAIGGKKGANCEEDLSPVSPVHSSLSRQSPMDPISEHIPMDRYHHSRKNSQRQREQETSLKSPAGSRHRPPVEGRDSVPYKQRPHPQMQPTTPDRQNANYLPPARPHIKSLPLRDVQRPDGQSPENKPEDPNANTPSSMNSLSPILQQQQKLFPDATSTRSPSMDITLDGEMEYDDYVPNLPGSYFTMDPHAYTLTWSQQPPWMPKGTAPSTRASSQASMQGNNTEQRPPTDNASQQ